MPAAMKRTPIIDWLVPAVVLTVLTVYLRVSDIDVRVAGWFYASPAGWIYANDQPWDFLYRYGVIPAWIISLSGLAVFLLSFKRPSLRHQRIAALYLALVMIVGPGLIVNEAFKKRWGRPRPFEITEFGGPREFLPVWDKGPTGRGSSFASGHAATGFYVMVPFFLLRRRSPGLAVACLLVGLAYGSLMGVGRMAQGKHFVSDVVWAWGFVYLTALSFYYALPLSASRSDSPPIQPPR